MDTDGNGHVSFEEYLTGYRAGVRDHPHGYERIRPISDAIVAIADAGSEREGHRGRFALALSGYGVPEPEGRAAFAALDRDGSGFLTRDELQEAIEEYSLGTDTGLPGNALFGRF